jgi:metal-responsive CopG/Arc/MetJ family transcriptional regulator
MMKRTQIYIENNDFEKLYLLAKANNLTVSELIRQAIKKELFEKLKNNKKNWRGFVGFYKSKIKTKANEEIKKYYQKL